jgi:hypothetical protein
MLSARISIVAMLVIGYSAAAAAKPIEVTVAQLVKTPERFHGKRISVVGYFDAVSEPKFGDLRGSPKNEPHPGNTIYIDLNEQQVYTVRRQHLLKGWVHVVGRFEYSRPVASRLEKTSDPKVDVERVWVGLGHGYGYSREINHVSEFTPLPKSR